MAAKTSVLALAAKIAAWLAFAVMTIALVTDHDRLFFFSIIAYSLALLLYEHGLRRDRNQVPKEAANPDGSKDLA